MRLDWGCRSPKLGFVQNSAFTMSVGVGAAHRVGPDVPIKV
jgi:hypothetical protein